MKAGIAAGMALVGILMTGSVGAAEALYDKEHPPMMYGVGSHSCGQYLDASANLYLLAPYDGYLSGYATARSIDIGASFFYHTDAAGLRHWLQNYCNSHPTAHYADAVSSLVNESIARYQEE
jgi:hypothetical protein